MEQRPSTSRDPVDDIFATLSSWQEPEDVVEEDTGIQESLSLNELYGLLSENIDHHLEVEEDEDGADTTETNLLLDYLTMDDDDTDHHAASTETVEDWLNGNPTVQNDIHFTAVPGLKSDMAGKSPIDFLYLILMPSIMDLIITCTNRYANKLLQLPLRPHSRIKEWVPIDVNTFKTFLGILIHMGTIKLNRTVDYWKTHYLFPNSVISNYMSRNKFLLIMKALNVQREAGMQSIKKIKSLLDTFNDVMKNIYHPTREIAIDESIMLFRGRLSFRQYMKSKRHQYGVKFYTLADVRGVCWKLHMYAGARDTLVGGRGHSHKVVKFLMKDLENLGHSLYINNYYSSIALTRELLIKKTFCTGTLRVNRKGNPKILKTKLKKGECIILHDCKNICVCKWVDKRDVLYISSEHNSDLIPIRNPRTRNVVYKPRAIAEYNKFMRNVDKHDQLLSYYSSEHKSIKWYKKVIIHIIQIAMINAFQLYKTCNGDIRTLYDFRLKIVETLLPPPPEPVFRPLASGRIHLPQILPRNNKGYSKRKKCRQCAKNNRRVDTSFGCPDCLGFPGLCLGCFRAHHRY